MSKPKLTVKNSVLQGGNHYISCDYGPYPSNPKNMHKGIDLLASDVSGKGADYIVAFADGKVTGYCNTFSGTTSNTGTPGMGNYVIIDHGNGFKTRYMHMLKSSVKVKTGDTVKKGQVIGYMGNTGNSSGRHLHFDISYNKKDFGGYYDGSRYYLDPKPYLKSDKAMNKTETAPKQYVVNVKSALNVRSGAGKSYSVVKTLKPGVKVQVYEVKNSFGRIAANQWVAMEYLK